ncbi:MAG TPA: hypothetical protein VK588_12510 [Chitinophagaceae bacterium]|nr:hypothetical protein [Chitinophagaceae bacterium]
MSSTAKFPTELHLNVAELTVDYFQPIPVVDTVLVVNSCAREKAVPESDLDFAILVKPDTAVEEIKHIESGWLAYSTSDTAFLKFKRSSAFAHIHLDIITGKYQPGTIEPGEPIDFFEVEIGNQVRYAAPMNQPGPYFRQLQIKWLPYYDDDLRLIRLTAIHNACNYDLDHIPFFIKRGLHFHALDILSKAFQEYLQTLFIAQRTYPVAYNKWIKEQVVEWLNDEKLYAKLPPILSINNIESNEINEKAKMIRDLLNDLNHD